MVSARGEYQSAAEAFRKIASLEAKVRGLTDDLQRNLETAGELQEMVNKGISEYNTLASETEQCWRNVADQIEIWTDRRTGKVLQINQTIDEISRTCAEDINMSQETLQNCTSSETRLEEEWSNCTATNKSHFDAKTECAEDLRIVLGHIGTCDTEKPAEEDLMLKAEERLGDCVNDHLSCKANYTIWNNTYKLKQDEDVQQTATADETYAILQDTKSSLDNFLQKPEPSTPVEYTIS